MAALIEAGVKAFSGPDGHVPRWFLMGFDAMLFTMWLYHDYFHCWIWGRGDGRGGTSSALA